MPEVLDGLILEVLPGAVVAVDLDDRVTAWNAAAERLFGWKADDVLGRPLPIVPPDAAERRRRWLERVAAGEEVEVTTQRRHQRGHLIDVVIRYALVRDGEGTTIGSVAAYRDASAQLRAATRLQRSRAELALVRRLAELVQGMLGDLDLANVLRSIVETGVELADGESGVVSIADGAGGYVRAANVNMPPDLGNHPIVPGEGIHGAVLVRGEPVLVDDYATWTGSVEAFLSQGFHASLAVPIFRGREVIGGLSVHSTQRHRRFGQAEVDVLVLLAQYATIAIGNANVYRQAAAEREKFLALVEAMPDGLAVVEGGRVTAWNATAVALTGRSVEEVIGGPPPFDLETASSGIEVVHPDGRRWLETVDSKLPQADGKVFLIRDMTRQRDLDRARDLFFASTSHELKTPLTVVKGLAATLRLHWDRMSDDERRSSLRTIERRADALDRLVERILVGSRVRAGAFAVALVPVDVAPLIIDVVEGFAAAASGHELRAEVEGALPLIGGDRQAIDTILGHLLDNAIKYSPSGGEVVVAAIVDEPQHRLILEVRDRGIGVEDDLERLIHPFAQADNRDPGRFGGVGLGLYIVGQLVEALGGQLSVARRDGGGSVFAAAFPLWS